MNWSVDKQGRGWFQVNNEQVVNPDWADGYWIIGGFDEQPVHLTKIIEQDLGIKVEPFEGK